MWPIAILWRMFWLSWFRLVRTPNAILRKLKKCKRKQKMFRRFWLPSNVSLNPPRATFQKKLKKRQKSCLKWIPQTFNHIQIEVQGMLYYSKFHLPSINEITFVHEHQRKQLFTCRSGVIAWQWSIDNVHAQWRPSFLSCTLNFMTNFPNHP